MQSDKEKILIVEDERLFAEYLKDILESEGYEVVDIIDNGTQAITTALQERPNLILMDNILKDHISGCEAAVEIHRREPKIEIIFLTAYADDEMIEYAMEANAAAYLMKPFIEEEILATIKLLFAHQQPKIPLESENVKLCDGYVFNKKRHQLLKNQQEIHLGKKVRKLLEILVENKDHSVSNEQLCSYIWGEQKNDKTLRSLIYRMRHLVDCNLIENINGLGYKIRGEEEVGG